LNSGGHGKVGLEGVEGLDDTFERNEKTFEVGAPDFNGNVQIPADGVDYNIILNNNYENTYLNLANGVVVQD
jgi:hypothetical protein